MSIGRVTSDWSLHALPIFLRLAIETFNDIPVTRRRFFALLVLPIVQQNQSVWVEPQSFNMGTYKH
jgi:hypothetical protein